jgi:hypothetical protein
MAGVKRGIVIDPKGCPSPEQLGGGFVGSPRRNLVSEALWPPASARAFTRSRWLAKSRRAMYRISITNPACLPMRACSNVTSLRRVVSIAKLVCSSIEPKTNASNSRLTILRISFEMLT